MIIFAKIWSFHFQELEAYLFVHTQSKQEQKTGKVTQLFNRYRQVQQKEIKQISAIVSITSLGNDHWEAIPTNLNS